MNLVENEALRRRTEAGEDQDRRDAERRYDTRFKQQKSRHLRISVSSAGLSPLAIVIGMFFLPIGVGLIYSSSKALEHVIDYTNCGGISNSSTCSLNFTLSSDYKGKVIIYYALTNFYQNHRRFAKSKDERQLNGETSPPAKDCASYDIEHPSGKIYWPCGALANAMFQDNFTIYSFGEGKNVQFERKGFAWKSDISYRFKNPPDWKKPEFKNKHAKPKNWKWNPWDMPHGLQNEDFIVWMRISALPKFRKIYGTVGSDTEHPKYNRDLPKGQYRLDIDNDFEVKSFKGTKSVIIATKAVFGGKNPDLGWGFLAVGFGLVLIGLFFLYVHFDTIKM